MPVITHFARQRIVVFSLAAAIAGGLSLSAHAEDFEFFEKKVRPLLVEHCYKCHSAQAEKVKGGLLLDTKEGMAKGGESGTPLIVPGKAEASLLIEAIQYKNPDLQMPPRKQGKLSEEQISDLVIWVNSGASDPRTGSTNSTTVAADKYKTARTHWAFQPLTHPVGPDIDSFIRAKLSAKGLQLSPRADKRTLIRRATFDLIGLPPTPEAVEAFVKDTSPGAYAKVVDGLLNSPRYGERWGRHWLDVARFSDTKGYVYAREEKRFIQSEAYRAWVIRAFNQDLPYDRFLKLQIAADQMEDADLDSLAAMGYLTLGRRFLEVIHDIIDDRIDVVMRGMQGLTVGCARCHDHKFDPIPTRDYYSLYGVFAGCYERMVPLNSGEKPAKAYLEFETGLREREAKFQALFETKRAEQSKKLRARTTEYLVAVLNVEKLTSEEFYSFVQGDDINPVIVRSWHGYLLASTEKFNPVWSPWKAYAALTTNEFAAKAGGVIASFTNDTEKLNPLVREAFAKKAPESMREVAERYGKLLVGADEKWNKADDKSKALSKDETELRDLLYAADSPATVPVGASADMEWYFDEATRLELARLQAQIEYWIAVTPGAPPYALILADRAVQKNPRVFKRGNPASKGEEVSRQFVEIVAGINRKPFTKGSGRLELAEAIASKGNPLTARVFVNRLWLHHFGTGLVRTPSDFGTRSEPPTHPELLDWLANSFMDNGWSVKKLQRLIMLSETYQQSSDLNTSERLVAAAKKAEPKNAIAAQVDPENKLLSHFNRQRLDFESMRDALLFASGQLDLTPGTKAEELFKRPFNKRRTVYGYIDRQFIPNALRAFDFANPDMHSPQRSETTSPQQALFFMNGGFVIEQARALAARLEAEPDLPADSKKHAEGKIRKLYEYLYQREPTPRQLATALKFIEAASAGVEDEPVKVALSPWKYGYGEVDATATRVKSFEGLPYFSEDVWQGGEAWPDPKLGWARLTKSGGHPGDDLRHAVIRRWVSPVAGTFTIKGRLRHEHPEGDGIRAGIILNGTNALAGWTVHNQSLVADVETVEVKPGDTIDFAVSINKSLNNNDFTWTSSLRIKGSEIAEKGTSGGMFWDARKGFSGPPELTKPLTPWEKYAQVMLFSNEFIFVD